jgi:hypothetical protein
LLTASLTPSIKNHLSLVRSVSELNGMLCVWSRVVLTMRGK